MRFCSARNLSGKCLEVSTASLLPVKVVFPASKTKNRGNLFNHVRRDQRLFMCARAKVGHESVV